MGTKLVDRYDMGGRPTPSARRPIVGVDTSQVSRALDDAGEAMFRAGGNIKDATDRTNYAMARATFAKERSEADKEFDDNPDFEKAQAAYKARLDKAKATAAGMVRGNDRKLFELDTDTDISRATGRVDSAVRTRRKDARRAALFGTLDDLRDQALQTPDHAGRSSLIASGLLAVDGAVERGEVTAQEAQDWKSKFSRGVAEGYVSMLPDEDQVRLLSGQGGGKGDKASYRNNIGNMIATDAPWKGKGAAHGAFETFGTPEEGVAANYKNVRSVAAGIGPNATLKDLAAKWAPADDGKNPMLKGNDPDVWARNVAKYSGLSADAPLPLDDPEKMAALMRGINRQEHGKETVPAKAYLDGVRLARGEIKVASAGGTMTDAGGPEANPRSGTGTGVDLIDPVKRQAMLEQAQARLDQKAREGEAERKAVEVQNITQTLFNKYGMTPEGEAKGIADIRDKHSGLLENELVGRFVGRVAEARRLDALQADGVTQTVLEKVWAGRTAEITPTERAALEKRGQWDAIGKEIVAHESGNQRTTDYLWLHQNYWSKGGAERMKVPLATIKEYTDQATYSKIVEERQKADVDPSERSASEYIASRLGPLKLKKEKPEDQLVLDSFHSEYERQVMAWQQKNGGKAPVSERRKIIDELTGKIELKRSGWLSSNVEAPLFRLLDPKSSEVSKIAGDTGIPADQIPGVIRAMNAHGLPLTIDNIQKAWEDGRE